MMEDAALLAMRYKVNCLKAIDEMRASLHPGQKDILEDPSRFKVLVAGRKWRKTSYSTFRLFEGALQNDLSYPYVAPTRKQAEEIVWKDHVARLLKIVDKYQIPYKVNESKLTITFPHGGEISLFGVDNPEPLRGISRWGGIVADEYADWGENIWGPIIRPNLMTHKGWALIAGTPKGFNHFWDVFSNRELFPNFKPFGPYASHDNPELDRAELDDLEREFKNKGESTYRQEILASFERPTGSVYDEWDVARQYIPVKYDNNLPIHITFDFGVNDPTAIIWIQPHGSEYRVIDYYESSDANIEHFVSVIRSKPYKEAEMYTGDPAGRARSIVTNTSPVEEYAKHGIHIRTKGGVRIPEQIQATHGIMKSLYVSDKLERFRNCLLNYRYPDKDKGENEIPIHNEFSHAMRALEYWAVNFKDFVPSDQIILPEYRPANPKTGY